VNDDVTGSREYDDVIVRSREVNDDDDDDDDDDVSESRDSA